MLRLVWTDCDAADLRALPPMSAYRREKEQKYRIESARRAGLCAEWLLIRTLELEQTAPTLPLSIDCKPNGKPSLTDERYYFNLSHSGAFAACALADFPLGIDIQEIRPCAARVARRFFSETEQTALAETDDPTALFTRLWCRKESFLKAVGLGLRADLSALNVSGGAPLVSHEGQSYAFRETRIGDLCFCLCARAEYLPDTLQPERLTLP